MPLDTQGFDGLASDIADLASRIDADGAGAPVARRILEAGKRWGLIPKIHEYGHGGPAPAPAHPFIRPAYDTRADEAYGIIRDGLRDAIDRL